MIKAQYDKLKSRSSEYLSIGITSGGEPRNTIGVPWEGTAHAFNMRTPDVYLSPEDLQDEEIMQLLESYKVIGCYIWVALEDYNLLARFKDLQDINIKLGVMENGKKKQIVDEVIEEDIVPTDYCDEISTSFIDYAVSVISDCALPDVRDGLKPVHRRILWAMKNLGLSSSGDYKKAARVIGETMGKYHPHGDASIYDAMVHMAQGWCYNHPHVDGHGNFGSVEGDDAAVSRYTEARLSAITEDSLLSDLDKDVVDFIPNFDNKEKEPTVLPACVPNFLISGTDGIAVGMASQMPTHNLGEVIAATVALIEKPKLKEEQLLEYIKDPDFATGGIIVNKSELTEIYKNGTGRIRVRTRVKTENSERGKMSIVVTEIPFTMIGCIDKFMDTVAELVRAKVMPDVVDIKNFSGKEGVRIVIELRKGADVEQNINLLYRKAKLKDTFGYNAVLLSGRVPYQMSLLRILTEFVDFYRETMTRKYKTFSHVKRNQQRSRKVLLVRSIVSIQSLRFSVAQPSFLWQRNTL